jgi:putative pyruvate formate lyase activating enzyme
MLALARRGCHNINIVTPSHVVPQILEALVLAADGGLNVPLVYNSGGYDSVETLRLLEGIVDIYMPDFKFWNAAWAIRFCGAPDYPERATEAVREMHRQVGDLDIRDGIATRGLLVRHLVMPGGASGTPEVMAFLAQEISRRTYVNVMAQYHPCGSAVGDPDIGRPLTRREYREAVAAAHAAGLTRLDRL